MSYGFLATNQYNQVLVSSDTRNLHFVQKKSSPDYIDNASDSYGGVRLFRYRVTCNIYPVPFFTNPTGDYIGITGIRNMGGNQWDVEMLRSGYGNSYPELYVFSDPRGATPTDSHGMLVYFNDGTPSFDSRLRPLAVIGGASVAHPSNPKPALSYGLSSDNCSSSGDSAGGAFAPDQYNNYSVTINSGKPMFHYASLAQAEREANFSRSERDCLGFDVYGGCLGFGTEEFWDSTYWCFYRGGIKNSGNSIQAGWIACYYGCNWRYSSDDSFFGIGIGGSGGQDGSWAYSNETLNLGSTAVIIGDASRYD
jgi:hypothetical protein